MWVLLVVLWQLYTLWEDFMAFVPVFPAYKTRASIREMGSMVTKVWQRIKDHGLIFELHGLIFRIQFWDCRNKAEDVCDGYVCIYIWLSVQYLLPDKNVQTECVCVCLMLCHMEYVSYLSEVGSLMATEKWWQKVFFI